MSGTASNCSTFFISHCIRSQLHIIEQMFCQLFHRGSWGLWIQDFRVPGIRGSEFLGIQGSGVDLRIRRFEDSWVHGRKDPRDRDPELQRFWSKIWVSADLRIRNKDLRSRRFDDPRIGGFGICQSRDQGIWRRSRNWNSCGSEDPQFQRSGDLRLWGFANLWIWGSENARVYLSRNRLALEVWKSEDPAYGFGNPWIHVEIWKFANLGGIWGSADLNWREHFRLHRFLKW